MAESTEEIKARLQLAVEEREARLQQMRALESAKERGQAKIRRQTIKVPQLRINER